MSDQPDVSASLADRSLGPGLGSLGACRCRLARLQRGRHFGGGGGCWAHGRRWGLDCGLNGEERGEEEKVHGNGVVGTSHAEDADGCRITHDSENRYRDYVGHRSRHCRLCANFIRMHKRISINWIRNQTSLHRSRFAAEMVPCVPENGTGANRFQSASSASNARRVNGPATRRSDRREVSAPVPRRGRFRFRHSTRPVATDRSEALWFARVVCTARHTCGGES